MRTVHPSPVLVSIITSHLSPCIFFFNDTATTEIYTLSLHDAFRSHFCPCRVRAGSPSLARYAVFPCPTTRSEEHTSELQSQSNLVCRLLLEKQSHRQLSSIDAANSTPLVTRLLFRYRPRTVTSPLP